MVSLYCGVFYFSCVNAYTSYYNLRNVFSSVNSLQYTIDFIDILNCFTKWVVKMLSVLALCYFYTLAYLFLSRQRNGVLHCCINPQMWLLPPNVCRLIPCIRWAWWRRTSISSSSGLPWRCSLRRNSAGSSNLRATKSAYLSPVPARMGDQTLPMFPHIPWRSPLLMELQARCKPGAKLYWQMGGYYSAKSITLWFENIVF